LELPWSLDFGIWSFPFAPVFPRVCFRYPPRIAIFGSQSHGDSAVLKIGSERGFPYSYEEFATHMKAMETVRTWEHTSRFGHLGNDQTSRANNARVVEYFFDCYEDKREAVHKAEILLSIYDYIGRNAEVFVKKGFVELLEGGPFSVESALLRAVHHVFTVVDRPSCIDPKQVVTLATAFEIFD
jgi:hypothetical protein